jgi:hypothetical protein
MSNWKKVTGTLCTYSLGGYVEEDTLSEESGVDIKTVKRYIKSLKLGKYLKEEGDDLLIIRYPKNITKDSCDSQESVLAKQARKLKEKYNG